MTRHLFLACFAVLLPLHPALAQNEPFRVINGATVPATATYIVRSGTEGWGDNLLTHGVLAPGQMLSLRPPEAAGCHFDIRLVLQDGREAIRHNANVCAERAISVAPSPR